MRRIWSGCGFGLSRDHDCKQNKIHDVTMYNASSQSNAHPEFMRMRTSKKRREYWEEIALRVEYSNNIEREFYIGRET